MIAITCKCCDDELGMYHSEYWDDNIIESEISVHEIVVYCRHCLYTMYQLHTWLGLEIPEAQERYPYFACREFLGSNNRKNDYKIMGDLFNDKILAPSNCGQPIALTVDETILDQDLS